MNTLSLRARRAYATAALWALASGVSTFAQDARLVLPSFEALAQRASDTVDVTLDSSLLQLAGGFIDEDDVKALLKDLKGVYVKSFEFDTDQAFSKADVDAIRKQLGAGRWTRMVGVQSERSAEIAEVYVWMDQGMPGGVAILSVAPRQFTVVNIVGRIDLAQLRRLQGNFGIPRVPDGAARPKE